MLKIATKTIYANKLSVDKEFNTPYVPIDGTTLNEKYGLSNLRPNKYPTINYFMIGLPVTDIVVNNKADYTNINHLPIDVDLFRPIPFLMKSVTLGITEEDRIKYRIIVQKEINGITYNLFYAKRIDNISTNDKLFKIERENNVDSMEMFNPLEGNINNPTPIVYEDLYPNTLKFIAFSKRIDISISKTELENIRDNIEILYPNLDASIKDTLGEISLIQSIEDETISDDLLVAQPAYFIKTRNVISNILLTAPDGVRESIEIGNMQSIAVEKSAI
jgi:hypothetical protein